MFIDNGDGTFTVRFYTGTYGTIYNWSDGSISAGFKDNHRTADYVTVDRVRRARPTQNMTLSRHRWSTRRSAPTACCYRAECDGPEANWHRHG